MWALFTNAEEKKSGFFLFKGRLMNGGSSFRMGFIK